MHWREIFDYFPYCLNCRSTITSFALAFISSFEQSVTVAPVVITNGIECP